MFPFLSEKLDMSQEIDAHKFIHSTLEHLIAFIAAARETASLFDAAKMTEIINTLKDPLVRLGLSFCSYLYHLINTVANSVQASR